MEDATNAWSAGGVYKMISDVLITDTAPMIEAFHKPTTFPPIVEEEDQLGGRWLQV
jgi:hypothetical protein